jgi:hypothetical protein
MWVEDPATGLAYLKLIRADYDVTTVPVLDERNITKLVSYQQVLLANSINEVSVTYHDPATNKDASVTAQNLANVQAQGRVIAQSNSYPGLWNHDQAARAALRDCTASSSLLVKFKVKVKSGGPFGVWGVKKGDVLSFSYKRKGIASMPVRVLEADYGLATDNAITLTCAQDIFGLPATTYLVSQPQLWIAPDLSPKPIPLQVLSEASYRDLAGFLRAADLAALDGSAAFLTTLGSRPSSVAYDYKLTARIGSSGNFIDVGTGGFAPTMVVGADIAEADTVLHVTGGYGLDQVKLGTEALYGGELLRVDAVDIAGQSVTVGRGCVDTVPVKHLAGGQIWFTDNFTGYSKVEYMVGEQVQAQLLTHTGLGYLDASLAPIGSIIMSGRQALPYPPGNLRINNARYPALVAGVLNLAWSHRNRVIQADQLVDTLQTDIAPESGTSYTVQVLLNGVVDSTATGIAANTYTPTVSGNGMVTIRITAVRGALMSAQSLSATFRYVLPIVVSGHAPGQPPNIAYSYAYTVTGGLAPFSWTVASGQLPNGLTLDPATGTLAGTPSIVGAFTWTVRVTDSMGTTKDLPDTTVISSPGSARSWRLLITANQGSAYNDLAEIEFRTTPGAANLCTGGTAFASSSYLNWGAANAFNGSVGNNGWSSDTGATMPQWIGYMLRDAATVNEVKIWCRIDNSAQASKSFTVQSSVDSTNGADGTWVNEWVVVNQAPWAPGEMRTFTRS